MFHCPASPKSYFELCSKHIVAVKYLGFYSISIKIKAIKIKPWPACFLAHHQGSLSHAACGHPGAAFSHAFSTWAFIKNEHDVRTSFVKYIKKTKKHMVNHNNWNCHIYNTYMFLYIYILCIYICWTINQQSNIKYIEKNIFWNWWYSLGNNWGYHGWYISGFTNFGYPLALWSCLMFKLLKL